MNLTKFRAAAEQALDHVIFDSVNEILALPDGIFNIEIRHTSVRTEEVCDDESVLAVKVFGAEVIEDTNGEFHTEDLYKADIK